MATMTAKVRHEE